MVVRVNPWRLIVNGVDLVLRLARWHREDASAAHKNLVDVEAVGRRIGFGFVASEFVDGQSLRAFIDGKRAEGRGISPKGARTRSRTWRMPWLTPGASPRTAL